jgi:hypothetical protein
VRKSGWFHVVACASSGKSQTISPLERFSQMTTTSKAWVSFLVRTLPASKRWSLHGFAFLPEEAAKQEGSEEIRSSLFSRWLIEPVREGCAFVMFLAHIPMFLNGCAKLSRRLARYYLAIALFQSPLSERSVTVSVSLRSPVITLVAQRRQVTSAPLWLSAFRVPHGC